MAQLGYPVTVVKGTLDSKFKCGSCHQLLRSPIQSFCGHRFCDSCFKILLSSDREPICLSCQEDGERMILSDNQIFPDNAIQREIRQLPVTCPGPGCDWNGVFADIVDHEEKCEKWKIPCFNCGERIPYADQHEHELTCPSKSTVVDGAVLQGQVADIKKRLHTLEQSFSGLSLKTTQSTAVKNAPDGALVPDLMKSLKQQLDVHEEAVKAFHDMFVVVSREVERNTNCLNELRNSLKQACCRLEDQEGRLKALARTNTNK